MRTTLYPALVLSALAVGGAAAQDAGKAGAPKNEIVKGRVTETQADKGRLTLRAIDGRKMTFTVDESTKLKGREGPAKLADFKAGGRVLVVYAKGDGDTHRAVELMPSYATAGEVVKEFDQAFGTVKSYAFGQKEEFERILAGVAAEANDLIKDLAAEAEREGAQAREEFLKARKELLEKAEAINKRLAKAAATGADGWEDLKNELQEAIGDFEKAYEKARSRHDRKDR